MNDGRNRIRTTIAGLAIATLGCGVLASTPSFADPDIDDVQQRVDSLYHEAEVASERYNDARVELGETEKRLETLRADLERQQERVQAIRDDVASSLVQQYQGEALSTASQMVLSDDPDAFLDNLSTVTAYNDRRGQMMAEFTVELKQLEIREEAAAKEIKALADLEATLKEEKAEVDAKAAEAEDLLGELEAEAAEEAAAREAAAAAPSRSGTREPAAPALPNVAASGNAAAAVNHALAQVGDAYVYGATGPDAYDCSGLTMAAWAAAGVSLPHSSSAQMSSGTPVSSSDLQPGDLVFYYSPVSHVGMYIGNGQIVHAANPSTGVNIAGVFSMPFSGAVRVG